MIRRKPLNPCKYNDYVECSEGDCSNCGWHPEEAQRRHSDPIESYFYTEDYDLARYLADRHFNCRMQVNYVFKNTRGLSTAINNFKERKKR